MSKIVTLQVNWCKHPESGIMRLLPLLLTLITLPPCAHAERGQSIMFGDPDPLMVQPAVKSTEEEKTGLCKQLRHDMDALKGKPQRRNAVVRRYRLECQSTGGP